MILFINQVDYLSCISRLNTFPFQSYCTSRSTGLSLSLSFSSHLCKHINMAKKISKPAKPISAPVVSRRDYRTIDNEQESEGSRRG